MPRAKGQHTPFDAQKNRASGQFNIWRAMRCMRRFTVPELVATSPPATMATVRTYVQRLSRAGYVAMQRLPPRGRAIYRLVRDTGPLSPVLRRDGSVFDPNANAVFGVVAE